MPWLPSWKLSWQTFISAMELSFLSISVVRKKKLLSAESTPNFSIDSRLVFVKIECVCLGRFQSDFDARWCSEKATECERTFKLSIVEIGLEFQKRPYPRRLSLSLGTLPVRFGRSMVF